MSMSKSIKSIAFLWVLMWHAGSVMSSAWAAGGGPLLSFKVTLNPVGAFVASSSALVGNVSASASGQAWTAPEISLELSTLKTGIDLRDKHMVQNYFEAPKFPKAVLKNATASGGKFKAQLTVHGKTQSIEGQYDIKTLAAGNDSIEAKFKTSLSAFDIKEANYMGVGVEDEIEVTALLPIRKGGSGK